MLVSEGCGGRVERGWVDGVFGVRRLPGCPYSSARPSWQVGVRRACVYVRRTPVALDNFLVVHAEVRRLCADYRCRNNSSTASPAFAMSLSSVSRAYHGPSDLFSHATRQAAPTLPLCPTSPRDPPSSSQLPLLCLTLTLPRPRQIIFN